MTYYKNKQNKKTMKKKVLDYVKIKLDFINVLKMGLFLVITVPSIVSMSLCQRTLHYVSIICTRNRSME